MNQNIEHISRWWIGLNNLKRLTIRILLSSFSAFFIFEGLHILAHKDEIGIFSSHTIIMIFGFTVTMLFSILATNTMRFALSTKDSNEMLIKLNEELKEVSMKDSLTGLWSNRDFLVDSMRRMCLRGKRNKELLIILFIDGNDFGKINNDFSHIAGDHAISITAETISHCLREDDFLFRYGGDEFLALILLKELPPDKLRMELDIIKTRINNCFENVQFYHEDKKIKLSVSIGEHFVEMEAKDFKEEIEIASKKMSEVKEKIKNTR